MLTKKDFIKVAEILRESKADEQTTQKFIDWFTAENKNFDKERFLKAVQE